MRLANRSSDAHSRERRLERETGIEPATNSLEGCDSTTELLPPSCSPPPVSRTSARQARFSSVSPTPARQAAFSHSGEARPAFLVRPGRARPCSVGSPYPNLASDRLAQPKLAMRAKAGGEGRIRTSEAARATDLQSAAFDRSATSPALVERRRAAADTFLRPRVPGRSVVRGNRLPRRLPAESRTRSDWSWRRDLNPRPADYKSAALPG